MTRRRAPARRPYETRSRGRLLLCAAILAVLSARTFAAGAAAAAANGVDANFADFDRSLLSGAGQNTTDLSRFEHGNLVMPGQYSVDVYLNGTWATRANVRFAAPAPDANAVPCVTGELLEQLGLRSPQPARQQARLTQPHACVTLGELIPGATMQLDMASLRLDTSVPQAFMGQTPRGYVSPQYWDAGIPAALLNYNFNSYHSSSLGQSRTTAYLGLNGSLNVGAWHFRHDATLSWQSAAGGAGARHHWQTIDSYVRRDLPSLRAQLTLGDSYTDGELFDSIGLRGVQLATDDRMLPDSLRGYAPVVRGVAQTNALVTVRQNGVQLYQATVAPGPFTIDDLYPTGYGGDLEVRVTEADGRVRQFTVPYASVAQLLRPGSTRFDLATGWLRDVTLQHEPVVVQGTVQHGFSNVVTGYAGLQAAQGYGAVLVGGALNTPLGAFAADVTMARTRIPGQVLLNGQSMRVSYSKILPNIGTSLSVAAYRYATDDYLTLSDAALVRDYARHGGDAFTDYVAPDQALLDGSADQSLLTPAQRAALAGRSYTPTFNPAGLQRRRNRFSLTLNQRLPGPAGSLYANASVSDYWNRPGTDTQLQVGYSNSLHGMGLSVSALRTRDALGRYDNQYNLSINLPLGEGVHSPSLNANFARGGADTQEQAMLNGSAGEDNQFTYGATAAHSRVVGSSIGVNGGYRGPFAVLNASIGRGQGYSQASFGMSGAALAHAGGITLGQPTGETVGLAHVPGARGARLLNAAGARVDRFGYALVPYLTPYALNTVEVDPKGLPLDVQLQATSARVAPHAGAVVQLEFKTQQGRAMILQVRREDGSALPFGTQIVDAKGVPLGVTGQAGRALLRGLKPDQRLLARWQDADASQRTCSFDFVAPPRTTELLQARTSATYVCRVPR